MHGRSHLSSKQFCRCSPGPIESSSCQEMSLAISPRFKAIPLRGEVAGIWTDLVRALRMYIRVSFTGLGTGREGNAACIFRGLLNARGLLLFPKKDRLCKGHMQDMPIPHAFWQPA